MKKKLQDILFNAPSITAAWHIEVDSIWASISASLPAVIEETKQLYESNTKTQDAFSRLGCILMKRERLEEALALFEQDAVCHRQSWFQQLRHAECIAATGNIETACKMVKNVYTTHPEAVNGYAAIAWRLRRKPDIISSPWSYAKRDLDANRISAGYMLNVAELAMMESLTKEAKELVTKAYNSDNTLTDGYARCAWQFYRTNKEYEKLIKWMKKDYDEGKLSSAWTVNFAQAYALSGNIDKALRFVKQAYDNDPLIKDGYTKIARIYYSPRKNYTKLLKLCLNDQQHNRMSDEGKFILAETQMILGDFEAGLSQLLSVRNPPPHAWAKAVQLWAHSMQWPLSPLLSDDRMLTTMLGKHTEYAGAHDADNYLICDAITDIAVMRERIIATSKRTKLDIHAQIREITSRQYTDTDPSEPLPFLNAKLFYACASDLLVLFNEIVLSESDWFQAEHDHPFIIDGGANIGTTLAYFKWLYPESHIVAFEPNPKLFNICKHNIELNKWRNIILHPYALAGQCGTMEFHCDKEMPMASSLTNRAEKDGRNFATVVVKTRTLDEFIDRPVDFLKLDIEGAECSTLIPAAANLSMVQNGIIEYHHGNLQNSLAAILQTLEQAGFQYVIKEPFCIKHITGLRQITPRWSRSVFFKR